MAAVDLTSHVLNKVGRMDALECDPDHRMLRAPCRADE